MEELMIHNLFNGNRAAQVQAANELGKFSSKQKYKLVEKGVVSPLISMLQSRDYDVIEASLFALLSLAFGSERNKIRIVKSGIVPVLLELLRCRNETLIELVMAALLILSSCAANKVVITSFAAIPVIVGMLSEDYGAEDTDSCFISIQAKLDAIATLHNLSTCQQIIPSIVSSGTVFVLLQIINSYDKTSQLVEKAMALLENIITSSENALLQTATTEGTIQSLVEHIEEGSPQCKEHAVVILLLICQSYGEEYRRLILMEGVMPGLLQLSVDGTWRAKDGAQNLLLLLRDYSGYGSREQESKHELIEQIMQEIDAEGETIMGMTTLRLVEEMIAKLNT